MATQPNPPYLYVAYGPKILRLSLNEANQDTWVFAMAGVADGSTLAFDHATVEQIITALASMAREPHTPATIIGPTRYNNPYSSYSIILTRRTLAIGWVKSTHVSMDASELPALLCYMRTQFYGPMSAMALEAEDEYQRPTVETGHQQGDTQ